MNMKKTFKSIEEASYLSFIFIRKQGLTRLDKAATETAKSFADL